MQDAVNAYLWLLDTGTAPGKIVVAGDSSGGGLAMSMLLALRERDMPQPVLQEAQLLAAHGTECGVDTAITVYPVPTHDFHVFWSFLPEAMKALEELGLLIRGGASFRAAAR